jgi:hypothetical protein
METTLLSDNLDIWKSKLIISEELTANIYNLKANDPGSNKSNRGGWQSTSFLCCDKNYYWICNLISRINLIIHSKKYRPLNCWFNINSTGNFNDWHAHGNRPYVAVLYISVPKNSGNIEFRKNNIFYKYSPKVGDLIIFPGNLEHRVLENLAVENRISLAINFST